MGGASPHDQRPIRICWVADDDEASFVGAAKVAGVRPLDVHWHRLVPPLKDLAGYDLLLVDPGALRAAPDTLEHRVHYDLPSLPIVFYSGLAQRHQLRAHPGLTWSMSALVHWIAHGEYALTSELHRRLAHHRRALLAAARRADAGRLLHRSRLRHLWGRELLSGT